MWTTLIISALLASSALAAPVATCATGAYVITVRGTFSHGQQGLDTLVNRTMTHIPGSVNIEVAYPASIFPYYQASEQKGVAAATALIKQTVDSCPNAKIVLMGYSQGAQIVMDTLCGCSDNAFPYTDPIATNYGSHVKAVLVYGDPSHVPNQPWDRGTATKQGTYARQRNNQCAPYANITESYCDKGDLYCAGGLSLAVHTSYPQRYDNAASQFIIDTWDSQQTQQ